MDTLLSNPYYAFGALGLAAILAFLVHRHQQVEFPDYHALAGVPLPTPLLQFDIDTAKPRPYRPFRWSVHAPLKKLDPDFWIELESTYRVRIAQRKELYAKHGSKLMDALPGSEHASRELMGTAIQFLCARYPAQFQFDPRTAVFLNAILGTSFDIRTTDPWHFLLENVPEDFLLTQADPKTGLYTLTAGIACSAMGWNVATKIGKPLHEIHKIVPDYKEKMQMSMDRWFTKLTSDKPIQRGSWGLEVGQPLFMQPGDPHSELRQRQDPALRLEDIHLRVDWQAVRRLPASKGIVFSFKALFTPMTEFRDEPFIPALVAMALREGSKPIMEYKGTFHIEHVALPALEAWAKEQEEMGLVPKDWKVRTLDEDPFFPGWRRKWNLGKQ
ncbi:hypothetical protein FIBSPDRAFT_923553 [Athelia psychrophila]|uniref:HRQ family protein n=1 Tax=Athelia psychrophila TaxID=1759441 RepID=A0A167TVY5_9AGAM|nr:hypothetical protein FIBSPDRAFT_923553 [Fibularhizoctonia sp. CBS 109695]